MADRVSAPIVVGGTLTAPEYVELAEIIADEGVSIEWDGERFEPENRTAGEPQAIFELQRTFGPTITISTGRVVPVRLIGQQHVLEDLGFIPGFADWVRCIRPQPWMGCARPIHKLVDPSAATELSMQGTTP